MKKVLFLVVIISFFTLNGCTNTQKIHILNWGDYIDEDLLDKFTDETGIEIVYTEAASNEIMYTDLKSERNHYDLLVPSEYMVSKMVNENLLKEIDYSKLNNFDLDNIDNVAKKLLIESEIDNYVIPYFFGTLGIIYNHDVIDIQNYENPWEIIFENENYEIGMYDSARDSIASALIYLDKNVNSYQENDLELVNNIFENSKINSWGTDDLKSKVAQGNLDAAVVYSGDYFDQLFIYEEEERDVNFSYITSSNTNIWIDSFVLPNNSNEEVAYKFFDFMLDSDNLITNVDYVGYCPPYLEEYEVLSEDYDYNFYHPYKDFEDSNLLQMYTYSNEHYNTINDYYLNLK